MYFIRGLIRSTILYLGLISVIKGYSFQLIFLYFLAIIIHILVSKLRKEDFSTGEMVLGILFHDIIAPLLGIRSLVKLLFRKYLSSPNEPHADVFLAQGIGEAVWGTLLVIYLVIAMR